MMKRILNICMLCLCQIVLFAQSGGGSDFDPTNPPDPDSPLNKYVLTLVSSPSQAGSFNISSGQKYETGSQLWLSAYTRSGYVFDHWMSADTIVSEKRSFYFTMPDRPVTLTAVCHFDPSSPGDPESAEDMFTVTLESVPAGAGYFSWGNTTKVTAGQQCDIYAYINKNGYKFLEWQQDGKQVSTDRNYQFQMPASNLHLVAIYDFDPANPENPNKNYWNAETGEVIIDDFTPGDLSNAVYTTIRGSSNYNKVQMMTIAGPVSQYDWGVVNNYSNCTLLDMSRTYGVTYVPSWNFSGNTALTTIVLPSSIESIDYCAFNGCSNLSSISIYAATPPSIGYNAFWGIGDSIVYVPADALALYQEADGWKDFTILPLAKEVSTLEVNLPDGTDLSIYKDMYIELINTKSGQKQRYVITNRTTYTFSSLIHRTSYNVYLKNAQGDVLGEVTDIDIVDHDVSVAFDELKVPRDLTLQVLTPEGQDVTAQTTITWLDAKNTYLTKGNTLTGQMEGAMTRFRITLPQSLGMQYLLPADSLYEVQDVNNISYTLTAIPQQTIGGTVFDLKTGQPLSGATVAVSQMLNGLYSKTFTTKTDNKGVWSLTVYEGKTDITASMTDYVSKTQSFETLVAEIPAFELKDINGTTISLNLTYTTTDGETQNYYSDYANVAYTVYNETMQKQVTEMNVQYPQIVLMEQLAEGTQLTITATSKNQKFIPVTATATVNEKDIASVTLPLVQLGGITATFRQTDNNSIVGILYDSNNRLVKKYDYSSTTLTISELQDGDYTLVTMANSQFFNSVATISQFAEAGLREGVDFIKNKVTVQSGAYTSINNQMIPYLDETKLYYTGDGTSVSVNKSQITTGNYLTSTGPLDFKSAYADKVSDVKFIFNLPEECSFVDNSVMRGGQSTTYTYADGQLVVPLDYYGERVRFCFIPTTGGDFTATGSVQFTLGEKIITQPIGKANYTVKNLSIQIPSVVAKTLVPVGGTAVGKSVIEIYDNGTLVGQTTALANGAWATLVELDNPYNLSIHNIYAKITTKDGVEMLSETKDLTYDMNAIQIQKVTMYHYNPEMHKTFESVFDFQNPHTTPNKWTVYYPNKKFTYTVDFTNNSPEKISNIILYVHAADGQIVPLYPTYDEKKDTWVADIDMGNRSDGNYPVNVSVDFEVSDVVASVDYAEIAEIYDGAINMRSVFEAYDNTCQEFSDQLASIYEGDVIDEASINNLFDSYTSELGVDISDDGISELVNKLKGMTEAERKAFRDSVVQAASLLMDSEIVKYYDDKKDMLPQFDYHFSVDDIPFVITRNTCEGLDPETLLADGYRALQTIESSTIYVKGNDNFWEIVDFKANVYNKIEISNAIASAARRGSVADMWEAAIQKLDECNNKLVQAQTTALDAITEIAEFFGQKVANLTKEANMFRAMAKVDREMGLIEGSGELLDNARSLEQQALELEKQAAKYQKLTADAKVAGKAIVGKAVQLLGSVASLAIDVKNWWNLHKKIESKIPCKENEAYALQLSSDVTYYGSLVCLGDVVTLAGATFAVYSAAMGLLGTPLTGGLSTVIGGAGGLIGAGVSIVAGLAFNWVSNHYYNKLKREVDNLKCGKDPDPNPNPGGGGGTGSGSSNDDVQIDPSGYVYEGVASNRLQGVTATAYYKETVEDMYGDLHENVVLWNAEEYAQENPLFTDEYGMYQWDVPQGLWQVKFEKEGYQTTYSEWLPVPPPQLEVNIPMTQMLQPIIKSGKAYGEGVEIEFDKYMDPSTLTTSNIMLTKNGNAVSGTIKLLNEEVAYEGKTETFASKVRFNVPEGEELLSTDEVQLTVKKAVKSYAGASKGKKGNVKSLSTMIAAVSSEELTLDENGQAELKVSGELPGSTVLSYTIEDSDVEGLTTVNVKDAALLVTIAPRASRVSGTEVYRGTKVQLSSETEGAVIYYTLDGSCPCNTETAIK